MIIDRDEDMLRHLFIVNVHSTLSTANIGIFIRIVVVRKIVALTV